MRCAGRKALGGLSALHRREPTPTAPRLDKRGWTKAAWVDFLARGAGDAVQHQRLSEGSSIPRLTRQRTAVRRSAKDHREAAPSRERRLRHRFVPRCAPRPAHLVRPDCAGPSTTRRSSRWLDWVTRRWPSGTRRRRDASFEALQASERDGGISVAAHGRRPSPQIAVKP